MQRPYRKWKRQLRELVELFLLPVAATLLPWRWSLRLFRWLSRWQGWYREEIALSIAHVRALGVVENIDEFARRLRWRLLVEHMDCFLVPMRGRRYLQRWVQAHGDPLPERGPVLFIGTHHGCGYWFLPYVKSQRLRPNIVAPRLGPLLSRSSLQGNLYVRLRHKLIAFAAGRPLVYKGGSAGEAIRQMLSEGEVCFGLCDMPTNRPDAVPVRLLGLSTQLAQNMFEIGLQTGAAIYLFSSDTDLHTGMRHVHFQRANGGSPEAMVRQFADLLNVSLLRDPAGWRFWSIAPSFFPLPFAAPERPDTCA
jgi:phosphatidylinositol dimannoside acyltransferase